MLLLLWYPESSPKGYLSTFKIHHVPPSPSLSPSSASNKLQPSFTQAHLSIKRLLRPDTLHILINMPPTVQLISHLLQPLHHLLPGPFRIAELGEEKQREALETRLVGVHPDAAGVFVDWVFRPGTKGDFVVPRGLLVLRSLFIIKRLRRLLRKVELGVLLMDIGESSSLNACAHLDCAIHWESAPGRALFEQAAQLRELGVDGHGAVVAVDADFCVDVLDPAAWGEVTI